MADLEDREEEVGAQVSKENEGKLGTFWMRAAQADSLDTSMFLQYGN